MTRWKDGLTSTAELTPVSGIRIAVDVSNMAMDQRTLVLQLTNAVAAAEEET